MKLLKLLTFILIGLILSNCSSDKSWRTASRESAGIAPDPSFTNEAILTVYGASAWVAKQGDTPDALICLYR